MSTPSASTVSAGPSPPHHLRTALLIAVGLACGLAVLALGPPEVGWRDLPGWLDHTAPEDVVVATVHLSVLAVSAYFVATTGLYLVARLLRVPSLIRAAGVLTLPAIRRIVDGALVATVAAAPLLVAQPVAAQVAEGPPTVHYQPLPAGDLPTQYIPVAAEDIDESPAPTHVVVTGDSLWSIAEHQVETHDSNASGADVARYWRELIELNRHDLTSGNPNVIFAGEVLQLPR